MKQLCKMRDTFENWKDGYKNEGTKDQGSDCRHGIIRLVVSKSLKIT